MEGVILVLDALALLALVVSSLLNDARPPGTPLRGPFRYAEDAPGTQNAGELPRGVLPSPGWRGRIKRHA